MSSSTAGPDERRSAKNLVKDIAKEHGYIGEEILLGIPEDRRRMIEDALLKKDQMIGSSVITLAKNLYSSKARFVFELLQNADDNQYTKAAAEGSVPFVRFTVFPRKIVLECNEDGFTPQNLTAICSIGKSSKTGAHGYIGEKGIGFKSVFMVAWKVHIQSGPFSFSFRHKNGDSGMGMISPVWEDIEEELESPLTRITLHLHETGDKGAIRAQFEELQETVLMFLRNIRKVVVRFYDQDGQQLSSVTHTLTYPQEHRARLQRVEVVNGKSEEQITHFHITRHDADGLSRNESRTYSDAEEASRAYEKSEIVLAFPLSHSSAPIIEPQDVFAFLPVRKVGFNFLIQADFVTTANRQDIVGDSSRNLSLIPEIANAFIIAASQFCEYATLRYEWLKYLPDRQDNSRAKIWDDLVDAISGNLIDAKVFYDNKSLALRDLSDLYRPEEAHFDEYGELLLDDGSPGQVISRHYSKVALDTLDDYESLTSIGLPQVSRWLEADLRDSASSRMKSPETTKDWHERTARLLNSALAYSLLLYGRSRNEISELKAMDLIPLQDGSWVSAAPPANIYFSQVRGLNIPSTLGLRLVSRKVVSPQRLKLFKSLGVKTASISRVRKTIVNDYDPDDDVMGHLTTETSRDHLEFLYLTENLTDEKLSYPDILVCDDVGLLCHPQHAYFNNHDTEVLKSTPPGPNPGDGAPGYFFKAFLDNAYFDDQPDTPDNQTMTWYEWFSKRLKVMTNVKLPSRDGILPMDLKYVHEYRPEKFLSCLVEGYAASHGLEDLTLEGIGRLRGTDVLCVGNHLRPLEDTYFPARPLKSLLARYVDEDTVFPWLWLDSEEIYETPPPNWKRFLSRLGVGLCEDHLKFALDMLEYSVGALSQDPVASARLFALYQYVQTQYQGSDNRVEAADKIRDVFLTQKCIYIPLQDGKCKWVLPDECVWSAPFDMEGKFALERLYEPWLSVDHVTSSVCMNLFKTTIGVEDCNWSILVDELRTLKRMGCDDIDRIRNIYQALDDLTSTLLSVDMEELRATFESEELVFMPTDFDVSWHSVFQCVWSAATRLRGRVSIDDDYESLKDFFVESLGVKTLDLQMALDELRHTADGGSATVSKVKDLIWVVNSLLSEAPHPQPSDLRQTPFLPIQEPNGHTKLRTADTDFCIVDRDALRSSFEARVKFLDLSLREVAVLRPFIEWMQLENRYLSRCVKEITSFHGGGAVRTVNPQRQIRNRAYAILRVAVHFDSPRCQGRRETDAFYATLRSAEIRETDGISSDLSLVQDGRSHVVEGKRTTLHIEDSQSSLKVYVPRDEDDQEYMFTNVLPRKLLECVMRHPVTHISQGITESMVNSTKAIMLAPISKLDRALEDSGIDSIEFANVDESPSLGAETVLDRSAIIVHDQGDFITDHHNRSESEDPETPGSSVSSDETPIRNETEDGVSIVGAVAPYRSTATLPRTFVSTTRSASPGMSWNTARIDESPYVALLERVITAARMRRDNALPLSGSLGMSQAHDGLQATNGQTSLELRSASQIERDCKIGAAGELFVFELLSHALQSHEFSRENWKSNIRRYVTVHPEYANMEPWSGRETSDIVYEDFEGALTALFVDRGYLPTHPWLSSSRRPKYFIEVKTTTMSCETPFYMSKAQYQRMRDNVLTDNTDTVYVIFRVFNLGRPNMGLRVYMDPETLRVFGQLEFTAESWSVVPV